MWMHERAALAASATEHCNMGRTLSADLQLASTRQQHRGGSSIVAVLASWHGIAHELQLTASFCSRSASAAVLPTSYNKVCGSRL